MILILTRKIGLYSDDRENVYVRTVSSLPFFSVMHRVIYAYIYTHIEILSIS